MIMFVNAILLLLCLPITYQRDFSLTDIPRSSTNWIELISSSHTVFSGRNAHATCVFKGRLWLTGGRTDSYTQYNFLSSNRAGDVWYSLHGDTWTQVIEMKGDYYIQNTDVLQPGPLAPWFQRYGHTLDAINVDGAGEAEYMLLTGGYSPDPSNDQWLTVDGVTWVYCGLAPWSPRAWHSTTTFKGKLWLMGGTPLNNEVWSLESLKLVSRVKPLTRSMYLNYTYELEWKRHANAPWSPRVGAGLLSHWYFNHTAGKTVSDSVERLVVIAGYGGWPSTSERFDGFHCRSDVWLSLDGNNWAQIADNASFGERAWFGAAVLHSGDPRINISPPRNESANMFIVGGGNIGYSLSNVKSLTTMAGRLDCYRSSDGVTWTRTNFLEGGGTTDVFQYSSQEWTRTSINKATVYLGLWGPTLEAFNGTNGTSPASNLFLIAGSKTNSGGVTNTVYRSSGGLFCDKEGVACSGSGKCNLDTLTCECDIGYYGTSCSETTIVKSAAFRMTASVYVHCVIVGLLYFALS